MVAALIDQRYPSFEKCDTTRGPIFLRAGIEKPTCALSDIACSPLDLVTPYSFPPPGILRFAHHLQFSLFWLRRRTTKNQRRLPVVRLNGLSGVCSSICSYERDGRLACCLACSIVIATRLPEASRSTYMFSLISFVSATLSPENSINAVSVSGKYLILILYSYFRLIMHMISHKTPWTSHCQPKTPAPRLRLNESPLFFFHGIKCITSSGTSQQKIRFWVNGREYRPQRNL